MNDEPQIPKGQQTRSSSRLGRYARRFLIGLVWLLTLLAVLVTLEDLRGRRAWKKYSRNLVARGVELDFRKLWPRPIPEAGNFAATPYVQEWFAETNRAQHSRDDAFAKACHKLRSRKSAHPEQRDFVDLGLWEIALRSAAAGKEIELPPVPKLKKGEPSGPVISPDLAARAHTAEAVLELLKSYQPAIEELRAAGLRTAAVYPLNYDPNTLFDMRLPHLPRLRETGELVKVHACASLAAGRIEEAFEDVKLGLFLADSIKDEPILVSSLVRASLFQMAVQPVWEGCALHRWSPEQLARLSLLEKSTGQRWLKTSL